MNYFYRPQKDITAYELSQILKTFLNGKAIADSIVELEPCAKRHFAETTETIQRGFGMQILRPTTLNQCAKPGRMSWLFRPLFRRSSQ